VRILDADTIRRNVALDMEALHCVEEGFTALARGLAQVPPIMFLKVPELGGEVDVKSALIQGHTAFAIKIASGFSANARSGLPTASGMMVLMSAETGFPLAVLLDDGYLTDLRTALAGAVAAKHLAPPRVETLGIVGTGTQARLQARALKLVRDYDRVMVFGRSQVAAERYAAEMPAVLEVPVVAAASAQELVESSDVVVTTTAAREALISADWLHPGLHITAMGSDGSGKQELDPEILARADRLVCDLRSQCVRVGELQHAIAAGLVSDDDDVIELGDLTDGRREGRRGPDEITVCDLTGVGVQDTAIALFTYQRVANEKSKPSTAG